MKTELVRFPIAAARVVDLARVVQAARADGYLSAPRCLGVRILVGDPGSLGVPVENSTEAVLVIDWESPEAHDEAEQTPGAAPFFDLMRQIATGASEVTWWEPK